MRRWEIEVGWRCQTRLTYEYDERPTAERMAFELARRTGEPVTVKLIEEAETKDDIPVE